MFEPFNTQQCQIKLLRLRDPFGLMDLHSGPFREIKTPALIVEVETSINDSLIAKDGLSIFICQRSISC